MDREELIDVLKDIINRAEQDNSYDTSMIVFDLNELIKDE